MEFYVDIADIDKVKEVEKYYPIDGFTTNPNILCKGEKSLGENMREYKTYVEETGLKIFVQVTAQKAEEMLGQARKLREYFGEKLVVKLPAVKEGYRACKMCKKEGMSVCITVVHSMLQALMAAKAGADYAAPYVTHIDNIGADGVRVCAEMVEAFRTYGYGCKVLGASFRTTDQVERLAGAGVQAVTITPQFFDMLIAHPSTDASLAGFDKIWKETFKGKEVTDFI